MCMCPHYYSNLVPINWTNTFIFFRYSGRGPRSKKREKTCHSIHCTLNKTVYVLAHATYIPAKFEACSPTDLVLFARSFFLCFWEKEGLGICVWNILMCPQRSDTLGWITWECEEGNMPEKYRNGTMTELLQQHCTWALNSMVNLL